VGLTVVKRQPKKKTTKKERKIFFLTPGGVSSLSSLAEDDAEILIKAKAIKNDPKRYENAKLAMRARGY